MAESSLDQEFDLHLVPTLPVVRHWIKIQTTNAIGLATLQWIKSVNG